MLMGVFSLSDAIERIEDEEVKEEILYQLKKHDEKLREKVIDECTITDDCDCCDSKEELKEEIDQLEAQIWDQNDTIDELYAAIKRFVKNDDLDYIKSECKNILLIAHIESGLELDEEEE